MTRSPPIGILKLSEVFYELTLTVYKISYFESSVFLKDSRKALLRYHLWHSWELQLVAAGGMTKRTP